MIIRSQNKGCIVNLDNIMEIAVHDKKVVCSGSYSCVGFLGIYSTEEKAIKVLDMICNFADEKHYEKIVTEKCGCIGGVVFNMPQDSEV